ncbi:MAG TPA: APC family permease [Acidobacteriaceae bacterium]|nr:APC family permease [Acidobacteriaceae bacterium]
MTDATTAEHSASLKRTLRFSDLILYGIILIQPTAAMPVFGVIYTVARGHVVTAILLAMIAMLFTAISYGRMARAYPKGGSAFTYVGKELHSSAGYLAGWSMAMDYILNPLICTIWCSKAAVNFLPEVPYVAWIFFFAIFFTMLNLNGVETSARINTAMAAALGVVIVLFVIAALRYIWHMHIGDTAFYIQPFYNRATFSSTTLFRGTSIAVLTYIGFDGISTLADEAHDPGRNIPRAIVLTCFVTGVLAAMEAYLGQLVWPQSKIFPDLDTAFVHVAGRAGGPMLFAIVNGALLLATIGSGMASQLGAARLLLTMGQEGALPKKFFGAVHPKNRIPRNNILLIGAIVLVGGLMMSYELGTELLNYGALIAFMGVNLSSAVWGWRQKDRGAQWFPILLSLAGLGTCFFLWIHLGSLALIAGTIWASIGILLFFVRRRIMLRQAAA